MVNSMGGGTDNESGRGKQMDAARRENRRVTESTPRPAVKTQDRRDYGSSRIASGSKSGYSSSRKGAPKGMR